MSSKPAIPAAYALHLLELVARWEISPDQLLAGSGHSQEKLAAPGAFLSIAELEDLFARARRLTGEDGLGIYLGMQIPVSAHGYLGFAAMTAKNIREALEMATRYVPIRTTALALNLEVEKEEARLVLEEHADLGGAREAVVLALLTGIAQIGSSLTGKPLRGRAEVVFPEPPYYRRLARLLTGPVHFARRRNCLVFSSSLLDLPLVLHDPVAQRLAREQCEQELARYGSGGQLLLRVRGALARDDGGVRGLEEVAAELHVSPRTLKRKLAACGTSYSELLDEMRQSRAVRLLRADRLSVDEIADRLGYSDAANFARAFRRWTGTTPGAFRAAARGGEA